MTVLDGKIFSTSKGLPHSSQYSLISPLLFNLFIMDMFKQIMGEHIKFAGDLHRMV